MTFTPTQLKVAAYGGAAVLLWLLARNARAATPSREATGNVDLGIPTIDGVYGGGRLGNGVDYFSIPPEGIPTDDNPAVDPDMRRLIDRSNALIREDDRLYGDIYQVGL